MMVQQTYPVALQRAGAMTVILPPDDAALTSPDQFLDLIDGLLLAGGADVDPATYGATPHPETGPTWPERDRFEIALVLRAFEREMPVLGACRGMQILNVALGGTLIQHLPDSIGTNDHRHTPGAFGDHDVRLADGSLAARAAGALVTPTKSHHHQGVSEIGDGFQVTGWAAVDELPEAIEDPSKAFALGVQWHPEADPAAREIAALVSAARG